MTRAQQGFRPVTSLKPRRVHGAVASVGNCSVQRHLKDWSWPRPGLATGEITGKWLLARFRAPSVRCSGAGCYRWGHTGLG